MSEKTVHSMIDWVEDNIEESPTLEAMARHVGYSSYYCSAKFHEAVGVSFKEYLQHCKMNLAVRELSTTKKRILDIAIQYGFSSHESFTRAFTKIYGYSPQQFRKNYYNID